MKTTALLLAALLLPLLAPGMAEETPAQKFNKYLADGYEVATPLKDVSSPDGQLGMLYTARKKNLKGASGWPVVVPNVVIGQTDAPDETSYITENWVVAPGSKKKLGLVRSTEPGFIATYDDFQLHEGLISNGFTNLWGPEQEGWHYGLLNYNARWGCCDIFLVNSDGTEAKITSIRKTLEAAARKHLSTRVKGGKTTGYVVGYSLLGVTNPSASVGVSDPLTIRIGFTAEVPKSDEIEAVEGTMTVKLSRDSKGVAGLTVTGIKAGLESAEAPAPVPPAKNPAPAKASSSTQSTDTFAAFRSEWNAKAKAGAWKVVSKDLTSSVKGRKVSERGWVESNVLQRLMHLDKGGKGNETITLYYWKEGQLTSVFQVRSGTDVGICDVGDATDTYNFVNEKLVSWFQTGEHPVWIDPKENGFQEKGRQVLADSIKAAEPIYSAIGAD